MTGERGDRGWIAVLAAVGVLVVGCTAAYLAAPFESPPAEGAGDTGPHVVAPEHRIVAVRDDGALQVIDARNGSVSETVLADGLEGVEFLDLGRHRETAFVGSAEGPIRLVRLRTGEGETLATGGALAVGPLAFPQIDPDIDRPEVDQLAFVRRRAGVDRIVVENLVTGSRSVIGPSGDPPFSTIERLTWGIRGNRLYGIADGGRVLFRIEADRADSLDAAVVSDPLPAGSRWVDLASGGSGPVGILGTGEQSALVEIEARRLASGAVLHRPSPSVVLETVEADPSAGQYLLTTASGELLRFAPDAGGDPTLLATGVVRAAW